MAITLSTVPSPLIVAPELLTTTVLIVDASSTVIPEFSPSIDANSTFAFVAETLIPGPTIFTDV